MFDKNREIIEGRFDATGRQTYWNNGFKGQGVKVAVIDDFNTEHGYQMASIKDYIAPECELVKLDMRGDYWTMIDKINEAVALKVNIISISRSVDFDTLPMTEAVRKCKANNILVFCSAGNDGDKYSDSVDIKRYPAYYDETISVMSIDNNYSFSTFASHNQKATITTFGQNVLVKNKAGQEMLVSGTSPSTAICAFTMALHLCKVIKETGKTMLFDDAIKFITSNVIDMGEVGKDNFFGHGFFTLDKSEFNRIKLMILDYNKDGLEDRVGRIKALVLSGTPLEQAEKQVSAEYYIMGYELINGVKVPIYGGKKQAW